MYAGLTGRGKAMHNTQLLCSKLLLQWTSRSYVLLVAGSGLNLTHLCVTSGKICWLLYVDALVLNMDGNVLDALSIAARVGMHFPHSLQVSQISHHLVCFA